MTSDNDPYQSRVTKPVIPAGWSIDPAYVGYSASHEDFDASYEGPEDGWVGNGLYCHGMTVQDCLEQIAEIEDEHPHFTEATQ